MINKKRGGLIKMTNIYFTLKITEEFDNETKSEEGDFMLYFDENGTCTDGESFNPTTGWTNYTQWDQGWSEQDEDLQYLQELISEFSKTMKLEEIVSEMEITDINKEIPIEYDGHHFVVTCTAIEN